MFKVETEVKIKQHCLKSESVTVFEGESWPQEADCDRMCPKDGGGLRMCTRYLKFDVVVYTTIKVFGLPVWGRIDTKLCKVVGGGKRKFAER